MVNEGEIVAVLLDLDDTLYPQSEFLSGAWQAVAAAASNCMGIAAEPLLAALEEIAAEGSDRGRIINRALDRIGLVDADVTALVEAFRGYTPDRLHAYPGAKSALVALRAKVPVGLVTDGDVNIQRAKLRALGMSHDFDVVVFSDELGREHRKPDPLPFLTALGALGVRPHDAIYIGDRPDKDVVGARAAGLRPIRVHTGEYADAPSATPAWREAPDVTSAITACLDHLAKTASDS